MRSLVAFMFIPMLMIVSCSNEQDCHNLAGDTFPCPEPHEVVKSINFKVKDNITDEPISGASVYVEYNGYKSTTLITNDSGWKWLQGVRSVTYIEVSAESYLTEIFNEGISGLEDSTIVHHDFDVYLEPIDN